MAHENRGPARRPADVPAREPVGVPVGAPEWAAPALSALLDRAAATRAEAGDRFPLFAEPGTGVWTTTGRASWAGGFWAGLLWLRARHTGLASDREAAARSTGRLANRLDADTVTRGLIFWYGTALADTEEAAALRDRAALACRAAYDPVPGVVPWGAAFGGPRLLARADGVPGTVPLLAAPAPEVAGSHLRRHLELCLGTGSFRWSWQYEGAAGWIPRDDPPSGWSRGRAWLLLAVADAAHRLDACDPAEPVGRLLPGLTVPPADEARPDGPRDTSAAAVTAVALLKLGRRDEAVTLLDALVHGHLTADGRLLNGCHDLGAGTATRHELIWGSFFLAYALAVLTGLVDPHTA
ncbi:sugar ABC transporter permease [Streptomyces sp. NPDC093094]|uniref:sugar ABC transporter permease n=1 Tax=Streptomyces sp. NPDC093094 TaxID=3366026 RepID=UPI003816EDC7